MHRTLSALALSLLLALAGAAHSAPEQGKRPAATKAAKTAKAAAKKPAKKQAKNCKKKQAKACFGH